MSAAQPDPTKSSRSTGSQRALMSRPLDGRLRARERLQEGHVTRDTIIGYCSVYSPSASYSGAVG